MNAELEEFISKCETCNTFQPAQQKEPLICYRVPQRPWEKVGWDTFTSSNRDYLWTFDHYSDYFEVDELRKKKKGAVVIGKLKKRFASHGTPDTFHSYNGPPFTSNKFSVFAAMYEFEHVTSSPEYPQSNGKVKNAVKTSWERESYEGKKFRHVISTEVPKNFQSYREWCCTHETASLRWKEQMDQGPSWTTSRLKILCC